MQDKKKRNILIRISVTIPLIVGIMIISSCENEIDRSINGIVYQPILLQVNLNNTILNLDKDTTGCVDSIGSDTYNISVTASGSGIIPAGRTTQGSVRIYKPGASTPFYRRVWDIPPATSDTARFSVPLSFQIRRSDVGLISLDFDLQTNTGELSNTLIQSLLITRNNIKPYLRDLIAPDTIYRPVSGTVLLIFSVVASDSDGYSDIKEVFFKRILPTETGNISLFDDGNRLLSGDEVPGDGRFTRILSIDSTARLGNQVFLFQASDKSGALSDSLLHTITILQ
jgi:hypothetical protein